MGDLTREKTNKKLRSIRNKKKKYTRRYLFIYDVGICHIYVRKTYTKRHRKYALIYKEGHVYATCDLPPPLSCQYKYYYFRRCKNISLAGTIPGSDVPIDATGPRVLGSDPESGSNGKV